MTPEPARAAPLFTVETAILPRPTFLQRLLQEKLTVASLVVILMLVVMAVGAPWLAPYDPTAIEMGGREVNGVKVYPPYGPSAANWFGTDQLGRDIYSRVLFGMRTSLFIGLVVRGGVMLVGVTLGLVAGYFPGIVRDLILRFTEIMLSFPPLLIAMAVTAVLQPSLSTVTVALILVGWPDVVRLIYGQVLVVRKMVYVEAARSLGATEWHIMWRHILPNILETIVVAFSMGIPGAVMYEAGLSFFGFGIQPPTPSLGSIISDGRGYMLAAPWYTLFPGLTLALMVLVFNFLGEGLLRLSRRRNVVD
jgi:peptide/nickel transport system permease protein